MKIEIIRETLKNKSLNKEFALITNLINGESEIFFPGNFDLEFENSLM